MKVMPIKKSIQLTTSSLENILSQPISVDFRLDESAWKDLRKNDIIEFWEDFSGWDTEPSKNSRLVKVHIIDILKNTTFDRLIDNLPDGLIPADNKQSTLTNLEKWWSVETQKNKGVIGLILKKI